MANIFIGVGLMIFVSAAIALVVLAYGAIIRGLSGK